MQFISIMINCLHYLASYLINWMLKRKQLKSDLVQVIVNLGSSHAAIGILKGTLWIRLALCWFHHKLDHKNAATDSGSPEKLLLFSFFFSLLVFSFLRLFLTLKQQHQHTRKMSCRLEFTDSLFFSDTYANTAGHEINLVDCSATSIREIPKVCVCMSAY